MEFHSERESRAYEKARDFTYSLFGEVNVKPVGGMLALQEGSAVVYVRVFPIGSEKTGVEVFSYVAIGVEATDELMRFLLTYNLKLMMGGFGLLCADDGTATVLLTQTMLGETLSKEELYAGVSAIAGVADRLDDVIVSRFGGRTAANMAEAVDPHERWE